MLSVCVRACPRALACVRPYEFMSQFTNLHEIVCERYAIECHSSIIFSDFLQSAITTWQSRELLRK
jgi:hypothetical protein